MLQSSANGGCATMSDLLPGPRLLRRFTKSEDGQALVLAALGMIVLMMMAGLGVDVGYLKYQKQQMQKAADAGALAGASALIEYGGQNGQTKIRTAARSDAEANGFKDGQNGISVQVHNPPQTVGDPFLDNPRYVEVIVSQERPTFFMKLTGRSSVMVSSRAVATATASASGCLYALSPTASNDFSVSAGAQISSNCGIFIASNSGSALNIGSGASMTATIGVVGDCSGSDCSTLQDQDKTLTTGIAPFTDPLASLPAPTVPSCDHPTMVYVTNPAGQTMNPGGYCGGIFIATSGPVTFNPGTYFLEGGGLTVVGSPTFSVAAGTPSNNGVTFYNTSGSAGYAPINMQFGTPTGSLTAPSGGDLSGILFFSDRSIPYNSSQPNQINGSGGIAYTGTLYFPTTGLTYTGARVTDPYELIVAWQLTFLGNTVISNNYSSLPFGSSPIANAQLVE